MRKYISEKEFSEQIKKILSDLDVSKLKYVTGPGRSGAIAAVYASHLTGLSFIPYKAGKLDESDKFLIIDTVAMTGKTIRKAINYYAGSTGILVFIDSNHRHVFWYDKDYVDENGA